MMRSGHSLPELLAALVAGTLLTTLVAATVMMQLRVAGAVARSVEVADAVAVTAGVLEAELRDAPAGGRSVGPDSVALRAYRAVAVVCDTTGEHAVLRWSGSRGPDASKDSLLVPGATGARVLPLRAPAALAGAADCAPRPAERLYRIASDGVLASGDVVLGFERGSYHLSDGALRWRVGAAGRQPLTGEVFDDAAFGFAGADRILLQLHTSGARGRDPARAWRTVLRLLDGGG